MIVAILQARMSSSRLPGKVLADLVGAPMILRQIERLRTAARLDRLIVATSDQASDDVLAEALQQAGVETHRGDLDDVLGRFAGAARDLAGSDVVVRLTADCPLADPQLIDALVAHHVASGADYSATTHPDRTYPKGLDAEMVGVAFLRQAAAEAADPYEREHVTPFFYRRPERFRLDGVRQAVDENELRWTVDEPSDLTFVRAVYEGLYSPDRPFTSDEVRAFVRGRPDLATLGDYPRI
ncbi:cytidylyltransferase domain-containing protein [Caulobacter hibisci]|uniref:Glycosyltransferase family protein n=1 Tax=Caulobacter hibisci TaxID=2035993 RepID=A0ABS0SZJ5_9CAUL|nr:glycosyltransferase family protein [Caulobacter hibisci]MBI1684969.1 glycosyltransferase family protein [Caulobacter hibisci]